MTPKVAIANLESGMPTANEALLRFNYELTRARSAGVLVLKVIHGYGSSGVGGALRDAVQAELRRMAGDSKIRAYVAGEDWRTSNEVAWKMQKLIPELKQDRDWGRGTRAFR